MIESILKSIGIIIVCQFLYKLSIVIYQLIFNSSKLSSYINQSFAIVTGATDGIGKEFAFQLAKNESNLIIIARNNDKLNQTKQEILEKYPTIKLLTYQLDFSTASNKDYVELAKFISPHNISILVNNVGTNHEIPTPFIQEKMETLENIINVNVLSIVKMTRIVSELMSEKKKGLIINVGSFAGKCGISYLQTYSGSKSFLKTWSEALAIELKPLNIHVEYLNTYFVVSNMSKIRRTSLMVPSAKVFVKSALDSIGNNTFSTPYYVHYLMNWVIDMFVPTSVILSQAAIGQLDIRKRALKKMQRVTEE